MSQHDNVSQGITQKSFPIFQPPSHQYIYHQRFNSPFYQDHQQQQYAIKRAFQTNNFQHLRNLPTKFQRNAILESRLNRAKQQIEREQFERTKTYQQKYQQHMNRVNNKKIQKIGKLGYFESFTYQQSPYQLARQINNQQKRQSDQTRNTICQVEFRPSGIEKKMHYEDPFKFIDKMTPSNQLPKTQYLFPFHIPQDVYDVSHECQIRKRIAMNAARIAGQFAPSKNDHSLSKPTKSKFPQIIKQIELYIKKYLPGKGFMVTVSKRDQILVLFQQSSHNVKVFMIMNAICQAEMLTPFSLRRNLDKWGQIDSNNFLCFMILPPWIKDVINHQSKHQQNTQGTLSINTKSKHQ